MAPSKWTVLALVAVGVLMCTLDTSIVNVSLPAIGHHFGVPLGPAVEWVIVAYLVVIAALLLSIGRLADRVGHRPLWIAGLIVFTASSALCGAAPALWILIAARALQGIGGAMLMAISPAMLTGAFPRHERGRALGLNAMVVGLGVSAGPSLGGLITEHLSWRWIFYVNLPIGLGGVLASAHWLLREAGPHRHTAFDVVGTALLVIALATATAALSIGNDLGWTSPIVVALAAIAVATGAGFVYRELRCASPVIDPALFRDRLFSSAVVSLVLSFLALFAIAFLLPYYFQEARGFDAERTGLLMTPFPLAVAVVAPVAGRLADRFGTRWLAASGMLILTIGLVLLSGLDAHSSTLEIVGFQLVAATGSGLFQAPNNSALMGAAPPDRQGVASGVLGTGRVVGQTLSVAIAGAVFASLGGAAAGQELVSQPGDASLQAAFARGFHGAMLTCAVFASIAVVTSLLRGRELLHEEEVPHEGGVSAGRAG